MNISATERILQSLNGLQKAEAPPHFYAGIRAKMQRQHKLKEKTFFIVRPAFISCILFIFLSANIAVLCGAFTKDTFQEKEQVNTGIRSFAAEYNLIAQSFGE